MTKDLLTSKLAFSQFIFTLTILLVIPCGIRQALYQILRAKNRYMLYTGSIILYQLLFIAGFLAAFISGCIACKWMINIVKKGKLVYFGIYCAIAGAITIAVSLLN